MSTHEVTPEMIRILEAMFGTNEGRMEIKDIGILLGLPHQETLYHVEELQRKDLVEREAYGVAWSGDQGTFYRLTAEGRVYVMRNIKSKGNP